MIKLYDRFWRKILVNSNHCLCNRDKDQQKRFGGLGKRFATKKEQEDLLVDKCGNPYKINLRDLRKILKEEI